jgi:hypothetical protein
MKVQPRFHINATARSRSVYNSNNTNNNNNNNHTIIYYKETTEAPSAVSFEAYGQNSVVKVTRNCLDMTQ